MDILKQLLLDQLAEDKSLISYRPNLNRITGGVLPTLLLQQILFRYKQNGYKSFYKFRAPCGHTNYRKGDSWTEELGFSVYEFDSALKKIGIKINKSNKDMQHTFLVEYHTTSNNLTYYRVHLENLLKALLGQPGNGENQNREIENPQFPDWEISNSAELENIKLHNTETIRDNSKNSSSSSISIINNSAEQEITDKLKSFSMSDKDIQTILESYADELPKVLYQINQTNWLYEKNIIRSRIIIFNKNLENGLIHDQYKKHLQDQEKPEPVAPAQMELENKVKSLIEFYREKTGESVLLDSDVIKLFNRCPYGDTTLKTVLTEYYTGGSGIYYREAETPLSLKAFLADHSLLNRIHKDLQASNLSTWSTVQNMFRSFGGAC